MKPLHDALTSSRNHSLRCREGPRDHERHAVCFVASCLAERAGGRRRLPDDGDCPGGTTCDSSIDACVPISDPIGCDVQYDCGGGAPCEGGFCEPGGDVVECEDALDCYGNDDVGNETCVNGVCYDSSVDLRLCSSDSVCPSGHQCGASGACERVTGACELDADCDTAGGESCVAGWCGVACEGDGACGNDMVCSLGRCGAACVDYTQCGAGETCWSGGCVNRYVFVGDEGGDPALWTVALPGQGDVEGGCNAGGGAGGGTALLLLAMALGLTMRRGARRGREDDV